MNKRRTVFGIVLLALSVLLAACGNVSGTSPVTLVSIEITTQPTTTEYSLGDSLDTAGMVVTATYSDGSTKAVAGYATSGFDSSAPIKTQAITVTYTEDGITMTDSFSVSIIPDPVLSSIAITTPPTKTEYAMGDSLDTTGMVVTATYSDGSTKAVAGYATSGFDSSAPIKTQAITVTYTEDGITMTASFSVSIKAVIGQIYYADGSVSTAYDSSKAAAGIVFAVNADGSISKIIALEQATNMTWAPSGSTGQTTNFNTDNDDGSGNWAVIRAADSTGSADPDPVTGTGGAATNYPAFYYCNTYGEDSELDVFDWYLPAINELLAVFNNVTVLNASLAEVGATTISRSTTSRSYHWSSSQHETYTQYAYWVSFCEQTEYAASSDKSMVDFSVRPIASVD